MSDPPTKQKIALCGLWSATAKDGQTYWSGRLGLSKLLLFQKDKTSEKSPDLMLYLVPWEERPVKAATPPPEALPNPKPDDDVPF